MRYRRANTGGATYFITANLADRKSTALVDQIALLRNAIRRVKTRHPFEIDAMVVLPEHFHLLLTLPIDDANFSMRISSIKSTFSRQLPKVEHVGDSRESKRERGIWQRRFWEHLIRNDADYATHVDYIHINPVKHGYVLRPTAWPHSSIHQFIARGVIYANWACAVEGGSFGEQLG